MEYYVVRCLKLEPRNPDDGRPPEEVFINCDFMEQVEVGIYGPFVEKEADLFVHMAMLTGNYNQLHFEITPLAQGNLP